MCTNSNYKSLNNYCPIYNYKKTQDYDEISYKSNFIIYIYKNNTIQKHI